jgi:hypothetical protein
MAEYFTIVAPSDPVEFIALPENENRATHSLMFSPDLFLSFSFWLVHHLKN